MKMKTNLLFFLALLLCHPGGWAQSTGQNPYANTVYSIADQLIEERLLQTPTDQQSGKIAASVKEIKRLRDLWGPRLFPHGDVKKIFGAYKQYIDDFNSGDRGFCGVYDDVIWDAKGPSEIPDGISWIAGTGQINRVTFSPGYNGTTNQTMYGCSHYGGAFKSTNKGASWTTLGTDLQLPFSGVADLAVDNANEDNLFIAASKGDGKAYFLTVATLGLINPTPTAGVYRSTNGGDTWEDISGDLLDDFVLGGLIRRVISHPTNSNIVLIATTNGVYRCDNALSASPTWTLTSAGYALSGLDIRGLEFKPGDPNIVYASGDHIYKSFDNGITWVPLTPAFSGLDLVNFKPFASSGNLNLFSVVNINLAVTPAAPNRIYAYIVAKDDNGTGHNFALIYVFDGSTWTRIDELEATSAFNVISGGWIGIAVSPINPNAVYYGYTHTRGTPDYTTLPFINQSPYSGSGFHADVHDLVFEPIVTSPQLYCGHHGGVSSKDITSNNSSGWTYHNSGLHCGLIWSFDNSEIKKDQFIIGSQDLGVAVHAQGATNWRIIQGGDGYGAQIYDEEGFFVMGKGNSNIRSFQIDDANNTVSNSSETSTTPDGHVHNSDFQEKVPTAFQVRYHPVTQAPIFGMNDLHERIKLAKMGGDGQDDLWKSQSNLGYITDYEWIYSRRISDFEIANSNPNYVYVVVQGDIQRPNGTGGYQLLKPAIFRSTTGITEGDELLESFVNISGGLPVSDHLTPEGIPASLVITGVEVDPLNENRIWVSFSGFEGDKKVWHSTNAGNTWSNYDPTGALANLPVNDIVYQQGSDDRIFAATDAGVYVKEPGVEWCRYGNIPNVRVMEVRINPCDQSLSAATVGRGLWEAPLPSEGVVATYRTINSNETWAGEVFSTGNIVVKPGKILSITGTLNMPKNGKIFVEQGGKLKVKGGTITNSCGDLWGGIEAWGVTALGQNSGNQAEVILSQGAIVEHAQIAIDCWKPGDWAATGGIAKAYNSTFRNNKRDIGMMYYSNDYGGNHYNNRSVFVDTDFFWDNEFRRETPLGHVAMYKVDGVYFTGCRFADNRDAPTSSMNNVGIRSVDASYKVIGTCPVLSGCSSDIEDDDWNPGRFDNLRLGIYASNVSTEHTITVDRSIFTNTKTGVRLENVNSPTLVRNIVKFTGTDNLFTGLGMTGFFIRESSGLRVEENRFENQAIPAASLGNTRGIACMDLGETDERIYKNTFKSLSQGNVAQGLNRNDGGTAGLQFLCNDNFENKRDHLVHVSPSDWTNPMAGVKALNGSLSESSGNIFTQLGLTCEDYSNNSPHPVGYFYNNADPLQIPTELCGVVLIQNAAPAGCPTNFPAYPITELKANTEFSLEQMFLSASSNLATKEASYASLINGGNTTSLINTVNQMKQSNAGQVRQQLMGYSPYLTEEVIRLAVDKPTNIFPHQWARDLVLANIDVARNNDFMNFLTTKNQPLPNSMLAAIQQQVQQGGYTAKLTLESEIAALSNEKDFAVDMVVRGLKQDESGWDFTKLRAWIPRGTDWMVQARMLETYLQEEDWNNAGIQLSTISSGISSAPQHLVNELNDYVSLKQRLLTILGSPSSIANLGQNDLDFMRNMAAQGTGIAKEQAQELLCFFYGECVEESFPTSSNKELETESFELNLEELELFKVYPNPAQNQLTVELAEVEEMAFMSITDMQGRVISQRWTNQSVLEWDTSELTDGIYFISVRIGDRLAGSEKVVIQH